MAFSSLAAKAEQRNFRDPEGFRAQMSRAMHRTILLAVPLGMIPMALAVMLLHSRLGQKQSDWILAVFMVGCFAWAWRMLGARSRLQRGLLIWFGILASGMVLKAAGLVSASALSWFFVASCLWQMWIVRWQRPRMDNSLFFRAKMGMLEAPSPEASLPKETAGRFSKPELKRFADFLADRQLINGSRWCPEGLQLRQTFPKLSWPINKTAQLKAALPFSRRDSSNVLLRWDGEVKAQISEADARTQRVFKPEEAEMRTKVEAQVAAAVTQALQQYRAGNLAAADRALGEKLDSEIFHVPPTLGSFDTVATSVTRFRGSSVPRHDGGGPVPANVAAALPSSHQTGAALNRSDKLRSPSPNCCRRQHERLVATGIADNQHSGYEEPAPPGRETVACHVRACYRYHGEAPHSPRILDAQLARHAGMQDRAQTTVDSQNASSYG